MLKHLGFSTILLLVALAIGVGLDLRVALRGNPDPIPQVELQASKTQIEALKQSGDIFVYSPLLSVGEIAALGDLRGTPAVPVASLRANRRVVVLDVVGQPMYGMGKPSKVEAVTGDRLEIRIYEPTGEGTTAMFDLLTEIDSVNMRVERPVGTRVSDCTQPRSEGGRQCPGQPDWLYIAPRPLTIAGKSETCAWAHPTTGGAIVFEIPAQGAPPEGKKLILEVEGALADDAVNNTPGGADVTTDIKQGSVSRGVLVVSNRLGWKKTRVDVEAGAAIDLVVTTPRDGRRHHCLRAFITEATK